MSPCEDKSPVSLYGNETILFPTEVRIGTVSCCLISNYINGRGKSGNSKYQRHVKFSIIHSSGNYHIFPSFLSLLKSLLRLTVA